MNEQLPVTTLYTENNLRDYARVGTMIRIKNDHGYIRVGDEFFPANEISVVQITKFLSEKKVYGSVHFRNPVKPFLDGCVISWEDIESFHNETPHSSCIAYINSFNENHCPGDFVEIINVSWPHKEDSLVIDLENDYSLWLPTREISSVIFLKWCFDRMCCLITTNKGLCLNGQIHYTKCKI
jgi:hypothetical protein